MKEFIEIVISTTADGTGTTRVLIKKSKIDAVQIFGNMVSMAVNGTATPYTFTLENPEAARSLYKQIVDELL